MRTSNKILIGALLFALLVFAFPVLWVRAKYSGGHFVVRPAEFRGQVQQQHVYGPEIRTLFINGQGNVVLIPSDTLKVEYFNDDNAPIRVQTKGNALFITTDTAHNDDGSYAVIRTFNEVKVYLPALDSIDVAHSQVHAQGVSDTTHSLPNFRVKLMNSELVLSEESMHQGVCRMGEVSVTADISSKISGSGKVVIRKADYRIIRNSEFEDNPATDYEQLFIKADSTSTVNIKGNHLRKATITSTE